MVLVATLGLSAAGVAAAQPARLVASAGAAASVAAAAVGVPAAVPFGPGERAEYRVHLGGLAVGRGSIEVTRVDTVRGRPAYHTAFQVRGGVPFYRVDDRFESWVDVGTLASLRHVQATREGRRRRERRYEIYPERGVYTEGRPPEAREAAGATLPARGGPTEHRTVERPFDEGAFVQFVRTVPLAVGQRYTFDRYFKPDRNPVTVEVLRRERVTVPAGTFDAVVVRPAFRTKGYLRPVWRHRGLAVGRRAARGAAHANAPAVRHHHPRAHRVHAPREPSGG